VKDSKLARNSLLF